MVVQQCSRCPSPTGCRGADRLHAPAELTGGLRMAAHLCAANSHTQDYKVTRMELMVTAIVPDTWIISMQHACGLALNLSALASTTRVSLTSLFPLAHTEEPWPGLPWETEISHLGWQDTAPTDVKAVQ